ncbi:unnamed protein product [Brachionus calyciflorus]|uniref:N-acetyltransferase domain-containing protein n=1 Tax=Brachionus calyciflorus TaxID=104777 RepID=A0A813UG48_9BILA|nr:unnamed protein product [Brachionus calyciflorus]
MEKAHDISLDEPCVAHQAILFMLDVLMRDSKQSMTLEELYDSFGDKSFTPQMLRAVGGNEQGLRQFLLRYPSLFTVNNDLISANSGGNQLPRLSGTPERYLRKKTVKANSDPNDSSSSADINSSSSSSSTSPNGQVEVQENSKTMKEIEQEAIAFFRKQMTKREEDWLPVVSVAGHASQSSSDIRKFVGPQNEFKQFLQKYPHIFVVRDEYCGLKGRADVSSAPFPPPSPPPKRRIPTSVALSNGVLTRTHSFKQANRYSACILPTTPTSLTTSLIGSQSSILSHSMTNAPTILNSNQTNSIANQKPRLTPVEVKAVHYVMRILHKNGRMLLQTIPGLISRAPEQVSNIVGFTREDLIQFFKRHSAIFQLHPDGCVSVKQDAVKALILKDMSNTTPNGSIINGNNNYLGQENPGIISNSGVILRIFPKYGILNMDNNEQVFFDIQSCQFETFSDLTTILHTGDRLYFNAMIGPRDGSTKWRSLKTWIKMKPQQSNSTTNMIGILDNMSSHSDADKSDDSSTSSSHGGYNRNLIHQPLTFNTFTPNQVFQPTGAFFLPSQLPSLQSPPPTSNSPIQNVSTPIDETNINGLLNSATNSSLLNSVNIGSGDFNQYQLDGEFQPSSQNGANSEENSVLNESLNSSLIQSASASNLNQMSKADQLSASKSINSFSNMQQDNENKTTKFMKQSPDNISQKETGNTKSHTGAEMVSIGCQTISTGDITISYYEFINSTIELTDISFKLANKTYSKEENAFFIAFSQKNEVMAFGGILLDEEKHLSTESWVPRLKKNEAILVRVAGSLKHRGKGAGKAVIQECINFAKSKNISCVKMTVSNRFIVANGNKYKKLGFNVTDKNVLSKCFNWIVYLMELKL